MIAARPLREAVARWNLAYAEQTAALFAATQAADAQAIGRLALGYQAVAEAWRVLAADLRVPLWARHASSVLPRSSTRRAAREWSRIAPEVEP